jgi:hypothetical protein
MNIFQRASKEQLRFNTNLGVLTVEDLWNVKLEHLDDLAVSYKRELSDTSGESFLKKSKVVDNTLQLRLDICKEIIDCRVEELDKEEKRKSVKAKNQRIMDLIVKKEDEAFEKTDIDELRSMLESED